MPVIVTDKKGHHVTGLRASDFQIFEDGVRQDIASFASDTSGSLDDVASLSKAPTHTGPRHTFVICVDTLHVSSASTLQVREALENLLQKEKPGDAQYVLIGIGSQLQVLQPATTDPLAILVKVKSAAFQNAMAGMEASALAAQLQQLRNRMAGFCRQCACSKSSCDSQLEALKQSVDADVQRWEAPERALLDQFKSVVEELAKIPTGRTLILVSGGFEINPKHEFYSVVLEYLPGSPQFKLGEPENPPALRDAMQTASDKNVIIFGVDSRSPEVAVSSGSMDAARPAASGGDPIGMGARNQRQAPVGNMGTFQSAPPGALSAADSATMEELARSTGGAYFHDSSAMVKQFRGAIADGRQYYMLSYVPKNTAHDGKFRAITVQANDKKLTLRTKSGYWAAAQ